MNKKYKCKNPDNNSNCKETVCYETYHYGSGLCISCAMKGKNHPRYINGKCSKIYKCKKCGRKISIGSGVYGSGLCGSCSQKINNKGKNNNFYGKKHTEETKKKIIKNTTGYKHTKEAKIKISKANTGKNNNMYGKPSPHGKRIIYKGILMRSTWETKYAKYLDKNNIEWKYESKRFGLGNTTYLPDFYLPKQDKYIEIKGWWRTEDKKRFDKFKRLYPKIKIELLMKPALLKLGILKK